MTAKITASIVMPCLDQAPYLREALDSVLSQQGDVDLECIVVDGGSVDGSLEILESYGSAVRWVSAKDRGQSDALNRGLDMATGDVLGWLNGDDRLMPGAVHTVARVFEARRDARWVYGKVRIIDEAGREIRRPITAYKNRCLRRLSYGRLLGQNCISQMGVFWRRDAFRQVGPFRTDLHLAMDYDYWLRLGKRWPGLLVDAWLAEFRWHPGSKSSRLFARQAREAFEVARHHAAGDYTAEIAFHRLAAAAGVMAYRALEHL